MKTLLSFCVIFSFLIINKIAFADELISNSKEKVKHRASLKISERKSLKRSKIAEENVSSFSMEELRLGAQKIPSDSEILYSKSQCRYAFMSDKEVIANRCEVKQVSNPK